MTDWKPNFKVKIEFDLLALKYRGGTDYEPPSITELLKDIGITNYERDKHGYNFTYDITKISAEKIIVDGDL